MTLVQVAPHVLDALAGTRPVVAFESTIFSHLGLPSPANAEALGRCTEAVAEAGAIAAVTAVLDGVARLGLTDDEHGRILGPARKTAARDLGVAVAGRWPVGATTVSASVTLAALGGVEVFATGGIGGVHLGVDEHDDVSADLTAIATHPVVTVSAGAKSFLDHARTLERLETLQVPVLGWRTDEVPGFYATTTGLAVPHRVDTAGEVATIARAHWALGGGGVLLTVPIPADAAIPVAELDAARDRALARAAADGVTGAAVTPLVLAALAHTTEGRTIDANLALAEHNARVAGAVAAALATRDHGRSHG